MEIFYHIYSLQQRIFWNKKTHRSASTIHNVKHTKIAKNEGEKNNQLFHFAKPIT